MKFLSKMAITLGIITTCSSVFADAWVIPSSNCQANHGNDFLRGTLKSPQGEITANIDHLVIRYNLIRLHEPTPEKFQKGFIPFKFGGRFLTLPLFAQGNFDDFFLLQKNTIDGDREDLIFNSKDEATDFYKSLRNAYLPTNGSLCFEAMSSVANRFSPKKNVAVAYKTGDSTQNKNKSIVRYYILPSAARMTDNTDLVTTTFDVYNH